MGDEFTDIKPEDEEVPGFETDPGSALGKDLGNILKKSGHRDYYPISEGNLPYIQACAYFFTHDGNKERRGDSGKIKALDAYMGKIGSSLAGKTDENIDASKDNYAKCAEISCTVVTYVNDIAKNSGHDGKDGFEKALKEVWPKDEKKMPGVPAGFIGKFKGGKGGEKGKSGSYDPEEDKGQIVQDVRKGAQSEIGQLLANWNEVDAKANDNTITGRVDHLGVRELGLNFFLQEMPNVLKDIETGIKGSHLSGFFNSHVYKTKLTKGLQRSDSYLKDAQTNLQRTDAYLKEFGERLQAGDESLEVDSSWPGINEEGERKLVRIDVDTFDYASDALWGIVDMCKIVLNTLSYSAQLYGNYNTLQQKYENQRSETRESNANLLKSLEEDIGEGEGERTRSGGAKKSKEDESSEEGDDENVFEEGEEKKSDKKAENTSGAGAKEEKKEVVYAPKLGGIPEEEFHKKLNADAQNLAKACIVLLRLSDMELEEGKEKGGRRGKKKSRKGGDFDDGDDYSEVKRRRRPGNPEMDLLGEEPLYIAKYRGDAEVYELNIDLLKDIDKNDDSPERDLLADDVKVKAGDPERDLLADEIIDEVDSPERDLLADEIIDEVESPERDLLADEIVDEVNSPERDLLADEIVDEVDSPERDLLADEIIDEGGIPEGGDIERDLLLDDENGEDGKSKAAAAVKVAELKSLSDEISNKGSGVSSESELAEDSDGLDTGSLDDFFGEEEYKELKKRGKKPAKILGKPDKNFNNVIGWTAIRGLMIMFGTAISSAFGSVNEIENYSKEEKNAAADVIFKKVAELLNKDITEFNIEMHKMNGKVKSKKELKERQIYVNKKITKKYDDVVKSFDIIIKNTEKIVGENKGSVQDNYEGGEYGDYTESGGYEEYDLYRNLSEVLVDLKSWRKISKNKLLSLGKKDRFFRGDQEAEHDQRSKRIFMDIFGGVEKVGVKDFAKWIYGEKYKIKGNSFLLRNSKVHGTGNNYLKFYK